MMKIQLDTNLFLESDEHNFILRILKMSESGRKRAHFKYFANLEGVAHYLIQEKIKESTAQNLKELITEIVEAKALIKAALREAI